MTRNGGGKKSRIGREEQVLPLTLLRRGQADVPTLADPKSSVFTHFFASFPRRSTLQRLAIARFCFHFVRPSESRFINTDKHMLLPGQPQPVGC
ncbi:unnamed protein product [Protopolystoma xenopodis]|uniref:Uncharacterized protein n=1 Tax=Protopolystoma xenopodis TaxID=117903 RepID=A0A3S5CUF8_9PLAT|nr:unnamed protein product [Protopolystoma xenopodis]